MLTLAISYLFTLAINDIISIDHIKITTIYINHYHLYSIIYIHYSTIRSYAYFLNYINLNFTPHKCYHLNLNRIIVNLHILIQIPIFIDKSILAIYIIIIHIIITYIILFIIIISLVDFTNLIIIFINSHLNPLLYKIITITITFYYILFIFYIYFIYNLIF